MEKESRRKESKREVLKTIGRLYDPLGFLNPFSVRARILLQEIWKCGLQWDEALPYELRTIWEKWKEELPQIQNIEIPRHYFDNSEKQEIENCQLHCFTDASEKAFGAVIYLRYTHGTTVKCQLVASKSRVAPLKKLSLPRLELMAALIGARLSKTVLEHLKDHMNITQYFWSDSTIVLHWIKGSAEKWKPFIENRVREIHEKSEPALWNYCSTKENPADLLTRGENAGGLKKKLIWWYGPQWLTKAENYWPNIHLDCKYEGIQNEKRKNAKKTIQTSCFSKRGEDELFDIEKFSSFDKMLRVTAWIRRYLINLRNTEKRSGTLTAEELKEAEIYWIKNIQRHFFPDEIKALEREKPVSRESRIHMFNPFLDEDQLLRIGGRLHNADLEFSEKHPIILPDSSYFAELMIKNNHEKIGHAGIAATLAQVREKFWLLKGRQKVKSVLRKCVICQRFKSRPINPDIAPLPLDRVKKTFPFEVTGIDFAGPLYTKNGSKAYIALFTCAVTRALHLELIPNLTTESFLLALRKFVARRGLCSTVYSDNAQTFKRAEKDMKMLWKTIKDPEVQNYFGKKGISWKFIIERAAWWGGFWERLVRSVKTCLKKILGRASLYFQELETVLIEVEAMINSRPLTYLYSDFTEPGPLTPAHFLIGRRLLTLPPGKIKSTSSTKEELTKRYIHRQKINERIWNKWKSAYLLELRSAHKAKRAECVASIAEGSVVLVYDDKTPRLLWKTAIILQLHEGRDGKVRACTLRLPNGTIIRRAMQHLYPMELDLERTAPRPSGPEDVVNEADDMPPGGPNGGERENFRWATASLLRSRDTNRAMTETYRLYVNIVCVYSVFYVTCVFI